MVICHVDRRKTEIILTELFLGAEMTFFSHKNRLVPIDKKTVFSRNASYIYAGGMAEGKV